MEQSLESKGHKIDSLLIEMTDIVRKLQGPNAGMSHADSAMMHGGASQAIIRVEGSRLSAK